MEHAVGLAHGAAAVCLTSHGSMPRGPLHALAVAITGSHPRHRGPLHDDRFLGSHILDREDRRDGGGGDRGGDDQTGSGHLVLAPAGRGAGLRDPPGSSSTLVPAVIHDHAERSAWIGQENPAAVGSGP